MRVTHPDTERALRQATMAWTLEEILEMRDSVAVSNGLDAAFDMLGILLIYIRSHSDAEIVAAHAEYVQSQVDRGRDVNAPHHAIIRHMVHAWMLDVYREDTRSASILLNRAGQRPGRTAWALNIVFSAAARPQER